MNAEAAPSVPPLMLRESGLFICPICQSPLSVSQDGEQIHCCDCGEIFGCEGGIPLLFRPNEWSAQKDVTELVRSFYERTPFPDYDELDSSASLQQKAQRGVFARLLDEQIPDGAWVLDAGCGTGQLASFLALNPGRTVVAADICLSSLKLGQTFKIDNRIDNVTFLQMNLFRPALRAESFHLVICNGVLHHTSAPRRGFESLSRLVRRGGFIAVGLYNTLGRLPTDLRRLIFRLSGDRLKGLDPRWRGADIGAKRKTAWFMDQYRHPHESKHTIGEVLRWFDSSDFEFVNSIPKSTALEPFSENEQLFRQNPRGKALDHLLVQTGMLLAGGREGGLFIMIGRKRC